MPRVKTLCRSCSRQVEHWHSVKKCPECGEPLQDARPQVVLRLTDRAGEDAPPLEVRLRMLLKTISRRYGFHSHIEEMP